MTAKKTRKLICIVTGKPLIATKAYYARKVEAAGSEEVLHDTYICREAKTMIRNGTSIDRIREILNVDASELKDVPQEIINDILSVQSKTSIRRINNITTTSNMVNTTTDPDVKKYINKLIKK